MTKKALIFPANQPIVGMIEFGGKLLVATAAGVYQLEDGKTLVPLMVETDLIEIDDAHREREVAAANAQRKHAEPAK